MSYLDILEEVNYQMSQPTIYDLSCDETDDDEEYFDEYWFKLWVLPPEFVWTFWDFVCDGNF